MNFDGTCSLTLLVEVERQEETAEFRSVFSKDALQLAAVRAVLNLVMSALS